MNKKTLIEVPKYLKSITLEKYQKYLKVLDDNKDSKDDELINLKALQIFCGFSLKDAYDLKLSDFGFIIRHLSELFSEKPPLTHRFSLVGDDGVEVEFGFIPKLDDITMGEFVDLDAYISDWQNMHKAMAVLYRPVVYRKKDRYLIAKYEGTDKFAEVMKYMPVDIAMGAVVFFYNLGMKLSIHLMDCLQKENQSEEITHLKRILEESGDGTAQFMHSLKETQRNLKKLQDLV